MDPNRVPSCSPFLWKLTFPSHSALFYLVDCMQLCECSTYPGSDNIMKLFQSLRICLRPNCRLFQVVFQRHTADQDTRTFIFHDLNDFTFDEVQTGPCDMVRTSNIDLVIDTPTFVSYPRCLDTFHTIFIWATLWYYLINHYGIAVTIDDIHWCGLPISLFPNTPQRIMVLLGPSQFVRN